MRFKTTKGESAYQTANTAFVFILSYPEFVDGRSFAGGFRILL